MANRACPSPVPNPPLRHVFKSRESSESSESQPLFRFGIQSKSLLLSATCTVLIVQLSILVFLTGLAYFAMSENRELLFQDDFSLRRDDYFFIQLSILVCLTGLAYFVLSENSELLFQDNFSLRRNNYFLCSSPRRPVV